MVCPRCGQSTTVDAGRCARCGAPLGGVTTGVLPLDTTGLPPGASFGPPTALGTRAAVATGTPGDAGRSSPTDSETAAPPPPGANATTSGATRGISAETGPLTPGGTFGPRYHIIRLLGAGGMGAVYQAWDAELNIAVALKVIRAQKAADAGTTAQLEKRFKNELLLARQVTHKHVVRIHDLGEIGGIKYITMPYVEGDDLAKVLRRDGKLAVARALQLARQIAAGLAAAHEAGVVHRDLKPANIMIGAEDQAQIMDFGISASSDHAAASGIIGTLEYMAPEQSEGKVVDARADIYAFGLILYEMLVGPRAQPPTGQERVTAMRRRVADGVPRVRSLEASVPEAVEAIVARSVERDPAARFQTSAELVAALDKLDANGIPLPEPRRLGARHLAAALVLVVTLVGATWWLARPQPQVQHEPLSVLIADFDNKTNDPVFQGSLEQALAIGVEGASFITAYPRTTAQTLAAQIKPGSRLDEPIARLISGREGIKVILTGSIETNGSRYTLTVNAEDPASGRVLATATRRAPSKADVLQAVAAAGAKIRTALGDTTPDSVKLAANETFTAASLEAARDFSLGQEITSSSRHEEAIVYFKRALDKDPNFGRAYASWAASAAILGRREEAVEAYTKALSLLDRMTEREKYRTLGTYYLTIARNYEQAIKNYTTLVQLYPADRAGHSNLALAYFYLLNFPKALDEGRRAVEIYPQDQRHRTNYALYAMYAGDFDTAAREARRVIEQDPNITKAYLPLAIAALANRDTAGAQDAYDRMAKTGTFGASLANMGAADLALYEDRLRDAEATLTAGIGIDESTKNSAGLAAKLFAAADVYAAIGRTKQAIDMVHRALKLGQDESIAVPGARILLRADKVADAQSVADALGQQLQSQRRAYAKILEGEIALKQKRTVDAVEAFQAAQKILDVWLGRFDLGVAYVEAGHYAEALPELELCQKRRGEATAIFLDDIPSFRYLVPLPYWLARAQEGLGMTPAAAANYKAFLALRPNAVRDPLAADARRRLGPQ